MSEQVPHQSLANEARPAASARLEDQDRTLRALHYFESAAGTPLGVDEVGWHRNMLDALAVLQEAMAEEQANADRPESLLSHIAHTQARLRSRVRGTRVQYQQLREPSENSAATSLQLNLSTSTSTISVGASRDSPLPFATREPASLTSSTRPTTTPSRPTSNQVSATRDHRRARTQASLLGRTPQRRTGGVLGVWAKKRQTEGFARVWIPSSAGMTPHAMPQPVLRCPPLPRGPHSRRHRAESGSVGRSPARTTGASAGPGTPEPRNASGRAITSAKRPLSRAPKGTVRRGQPPGDWSTSLRVAI